jgi:bifunctional non-homologous end joining protein LigD
MDLRRVPCITRRAVLKDLFDERGTDAVRFSQAFEVTPGQMLVQPDPNATHVLLGVTPK